MKQVPEMRNDTKKTGGNTVGGQGTEGRAVTATSGDENARRATEIGPVLEEILHDHWKHWGLND
ncbi:MAG TPA: hypothetical protein VN625_03145 [Desulfuromonadaceae bacterium]|nr:hypothetical protein [Desulfuromonadaceae bacterium]